MNLDELKTKLEAVKRKEQELDVREQALNALLPVSPVLAGDVRASVASNNTALLKEITEAIGEQKNSSEIIEALERQTEALEDGISKQAIESLKDLVKQIQKLGEKKYFDQAEFDKVFNTGIAKIVNILVSQEELPEKTKYTRNSKGKITLVTETYSGFTLKHFWSYNSNGQLTGVRTEKDEIK